MQCSLDTQQVVHYQKQSLRSKISNQDFLYIDLSFVRSFYFLSKDCNHLVNDKL